MIELFMLGKEFWSEGTASPNARENLEKMGWKAKEKSQRSCCYIYKKSEMDTMVNTETALHVLGGYHKITAEFLKVLIPKGTERADAICTVCYVKDRGPPVI